MALHERYVDELVGMYNLESFKPKTTADMAQWSGEDGDLDSGEAHRFRSAMGTLLYISANRWDIQRSVRHVAQWMAKPSKLARAGVRHLILYLTGTRTYALNFPYRMGGTKLDEVYGRERNEELGECVEVFTNSDWAGARSKSTERRRHSIFSAMIFLNGRPVISW